MARRTMDPLQTAAGFEPKQKASRRLASLDRVQGRGTLRVGGPNKVELFDGTPLVGRRPRDTGSTIPQAYASTVWLQQGGDTSDAAWTSTSVATINTAGWYELHGTLACSTTAVGTLYGRYTKNASPLQDFGTTAAGNTGIEFTHSGENGRAIQVDCWEPRTRLNVGDTIILQHQFDSIATSTWSDSTFAIRCIAPVDDMQLTKGAGTSIPAGPDLTWLVLAANSADITGVALTEYARFSDLTIGVYHYKCQLIFQTTAITTGMQCSVFYTGTTAQCIAERRMVTTGSTDATGDFTGDAVGANGNLYEAQGQRVNGTAIGGATTDIDTANSDLMATIQGFVRVTNGGDLVFYLAAELAGLTVRAMQGTTIELKRVSQ